MSTKIVLALGMFDGVHIGHQALLRVAHEKAEEVGARPLAFTFPNHPGALFGQDIPLLNTPEEKAARIAALGVDVQMTPFDAAFAAQTPEVFMDALLARFCAAGIVAGYNYRFGAGAAGDMALLEALCRARGVDVTIVPEVSENGQPISSTRIRELLLQKRVPEANRLLGSPYAFYGKVQSDRGVGTRIGFPTANLLPGPKVTPHGVFAAWFVADGKRRAAVTNIGVRPTFSAQGVTVETHALDCYEIYYGKDVSVELIAFLRDERRFASPEELVSQIRIDCGQARECLQGCSKKTCIASLTHIKP